MVVFMNQPMGEFPMLVLPPMHSTYMARHTKSIDFLLTFWIIMTTMLKVPLPF